MLREASTREGWYWQADSEHNTLVGILNSDVEAATVLISLDYYWQGQRGTYEMEEMELPARGSYLLDIGALIASGTPDRDSNRVPRGVTSGGYRVQKTDPRQGVNITTEALLIDRRGSNFLTFYNTGCCHTLATLTPQSLSGVPGSNGEVQVNAADTCTGALIVPNLTCSSTYISLNQSVATTAFCGHVYYKDPGFATVISRTYHYRESIPGYGCDSDYDLGLCGVTVRPQITTISPARGAIGNTTAVTINGIGFGTSPTVQAGSGITVNITSASNTQIQANFVVAANSPVGNHSVTVTANGQTSNSVSFFVQVPTSLSIVAGTDSTTSESECTYTDVNGNPQTGCGVVRSFVYQVKDQSGQAIQAVMEVWDQITTTSPNNLAITGYLTTCPGGSGPCGITTNSLGQFQEHSLSVCSSVCRSNNVCVQGGPTNANQVIHVGPATITQAISYRCEQITVNGQ